MRILIVTMLTGLAATAAWGATPYKQTLNVKKNSYLREGVFTGGKAGEPTSLLGVRRTYSGKAGIERVIMDMGDGEAKPLRGSDLSYFQVAMDQSNRRIVVDLAQLKYAKINEGQLRQIFRKSPMVKSASLTFDPEDKAGTMVLELKKPARLEVFRLGGAKKNGRLVLDLKALNPAKPKVR